MPKLKLTLTPNVALGMLTQILLNLINYGVSIVVGLKYKLNCK